MGGAPNRASPASWIARSLSSDRNVFPSASVFSFEGNESNESNVFFDSFDSFSLVSLKLKDLVAILGDAVIGKGSEHDPKVSKHAFAEFS